MDYTQNSSDAFRRLRRRESGQKFLTEILNLKTAKEPDKNIGSDCILQNRQLIFSPKIPYDLVAERSEATATCLQFPVCWKWADLNRRAESFLKQLYKLAPAVFNQEVLAGENLPDFDPV